MFLPVTASVYEDEEDEEDEKQDFFLVFVSRGSEGPLPHRLCLGYQKNEYLVAVPRSHLTLKIQKSVVIINPVAETSLPPVHTICVMKS